MIASLTKEFQHHALFKSQTDKVSIENYLTTSQNIQVYTTEFGEKILAIQYKAVFTGALANTLRNFMFVQCVYHKNVHTTESVMFSLCANDHLDHQENKSQN